MKYKDAGVDITAAEDAVERIKAKVRSTFNKNVITDLGKFGGFFSLDQSKFKEPVLVSSIDGVGTKLKVAFLMQRYDTVGEDLVNHCINDILVGGAKPLFFLDYIGTGKLKPEVIEEVITGMTRACQDADCALIGGEMAEMPGFYEKGEFDLAGCIVGIVEKSRIIDGSTIDKGNILIGLKSNGLHTNGYSLARKVLLEQKGYDVKTRPDELDCSIGEELLRVHRCYLPVISHLLDRFKINGMSHVTGGGIIGNTKRILPKGFDLRIEWSNWIVPSVFNLIQKLGTVPDEDMRRTFNLGIGFILIVDRDTADPLGKALEEIGEEPVTVGKIV
jgi:phosphoribosylformylglycinamidine cyclo-ligase